VFNISLNFDLYLQRSLDCTSYRCFDIHFILTSLLLPRLTGHFISPRVGHGESLRGSRTSMCDSNLYHLGLYQKARGGWSVKGGRSLVPACVVYLFSMHILSMSNGFDLGSSGTEDISLLSCKRERVSRTLNDIIFYKCIAIVIFIKDRTLLSIRNFGRSVPLSF